MFKRITLHEGLRVINTNHIVSVNLKEDFQNDRFIVSITLVSREELTCSQHPSHDAAMKAMSELEQMLVGQFAQDI